MVSNTVLDGVPQVVGWGTDAHGVDYWTIANSWTTDWGMNGFFNIRRGMHTRRAPFAFSMMGGQFDSVRSRMMRHTPMRALSQLVCTS